MVQVCRIHIIYAVVDRVAYDPCLLYTSSKGIRVTAEDKEVAVEAAIVAEYGRSIPVIAQSIRSNIVRAIESMTGLNVTKVDVRIQKLDMSAVGNEAAAYA